MIDPVLGQEFANLVTVWGNTAAGEAKEAAFNKMIDWLVTNKTLGQAAAKGATSDVVYQHLMHRVLAVRRHSA